MASAPASAFSDAPVSTAPVLRFTEIPEAVQAMAALCERRAALVEEVRRIDAVLDALELPGAGRPQIGQR